MTMRALTIRVSEPTYAELKREAAEQNLRGVAEAVRRAIEDATADYKSVVRYVDTAQTQEIRKQLSALMGCMSDIRVELRRIGVNYNQELKIKQIKAKYAKSGLNGIMQQQKEIEDLKKEAGALDLPKLESLIARYEAATKEAGELLWPILG